MLIMPTILLTKDVLIIPEYILGLISSFFIPTHVIGDVKTLFSDGRNKTE
jgi:hypothetical protein